MNQLETVLVTGAQGFIGSVMCARLSELGYEVIAVDSGVRGLNDPRDLPHLTFYQQDCLDQDAMRALLRTHQPAAVMHFAAATGDLSRPVQELTRLNVEMTWALYTIMRESAPDAVLLFPTTSLALGVPESSYVQTKEAAVRQLLVEDPGRRSTLLFRFFNTVGAYRGFSELRRNEVHLLPRLWAAWRAGEVFTIHGDDYEITGDGTPARTFVHVLDLVDYLLYAWGLHRGGRLHELPTVDGLIEVGGATVATVRQVIECLEEQTRREYRDAQDFRRALSRPQQVNVTIGPRRAFDCGLIVPSPASIAAFTGWRPQRGLDAMVRDELYALEAFYGPEQAD